MKTRRALTLALIALQAVAFWIVNSNSPFAIAVCVVAFIGVWGRIQLRLTLERQIIVIMLCLAVFAAKGRLAPLRVTAGASDLPFFGVAMDYGIAHAIAQGALVAQVALLFVYHPRGLPAFIPAMAATALVLVGNVPVFTLTSAPLGLRSAPRGVYHAFAFGIAFLTPLYATTCRRMHGQASPKRRPLGRWAALAMILVFALGGGWVASELLYRYRNDIDSTLIKFISKLRTNPTSVGFSRAASLDSITSMRGTQSSRTALRIMSGEPPGYLRGMVFDQYDAPRWRFDQQRKDVGPSRIFPGMPKPAPRENAFDLRPEKGTTPEGTWTLHVSPSPAVEDSLFTPLGAEFIYAAESTIALGPYGIARSRTMPHGASYSGVAVEKPGWTPLSDDERAALTTLPGTLDRRIYSLAELVTRDCATDREKIDAVRTYFTSNYDYHLGIRVPTGRDPLTYFLLEKPAAHCEYFASGAAVLLRCAGVPTRYVTGFFVGEKNPYGGYWVARNKDAHAWVEAYDREAGWTLVEATPGSGIPTGAVGRASQFYDYLKFRIKELLEALRNGGIRAFLGACLLLVWEIVKAVLVSIYGAAFLALAAFILALRWWRKRRARPRAAHDPALIALRALLARADAALRKLGHTRAPHETLHQFARRIAGAGLQSAATWYRTYAATRYQRATDTQALETLERELPGAE